MIHRPPATTQNNATASEPSRQKLGPLVDPNMGLRTISSRAKNTKPLLGGGHRGERTSAPYGGGTMSAYARCEAVADNLVRNWGDHLGSVPKNVEGVDLVRWCVEVNCVGDPVGWAVRQPSAGWVWIETAHKNPVARFPVAFMYPRHGLQRSTTWRRAYPPHLAHQW